VYVELWCEKDAVIGSIQDTTDALGVPVRVGRGFQSTTSQHVQTVSRCQEQQTWISTNLLSSLVKGKP
jgi:hypothetical protein